jgi:hypothetical protein
MKKRILFLLLGVLAITLMFGLSSVTAHSYDNYGYGNSYYKYGHSDTYSSHFVKSSPHYNYEKTVFKDPWSYRSTVRKINYGHGSYNPPRYYSYGYYNQLGNYWNYGYHPPQYVYSNTYRSYY